MSSTTRSRQSLGEAALKGALAGLVGGAVLRAVWEAGQRALPAGQRLPSPTDEMVRTLAARRGARLSPGQTRAASLGMYSGVMLGWGAAFNVLGTRLGVPPLPQGLALGGWIYALNFPKATGVLPRKGILPAPSEQAPAQAAVPIAAHAAFGLATAAVLSALDDR